MKTTIPIFALTILLFACAQTPERLKSEVPAREERVSDHYSRGAVNNYELYGADIDGHVVMLVWLTTGEHFPMLCRKNKNGILPIPQSVFAEQGAERWSIMCEPRFHNTYALMRLKLSRAEGALFMRDRKLKPVARVALLSQPL